MAKSVYEILLKLEGDSQVKASLQAIGTQLGLTGAALTAFGVGAAKLAADYETALANVATVSGEATGTTEEFSQRLFQLQADMKGAINVQEAAVASYDALSAGIKDQDAVMAALELSQKAAIAGQSNLNSIMKAAISGVNAYGEALGVGTNQVDQFDKIINLMLQTQLDGVITAEEYARSFGQIASLANSAGINIEVLNAAIATTTAKGIPASIAFTNLKAAISNITGPTSIAQEEAERLGIEFNAAALKAKGLDGILRDIVNSEAYDENSINKLFGSTEARASIAALLSDMGLFEQNIQNQLNGMNALNTAYELVADTANRKVANAFNQIQGALIEIGQGAMVVLAPIIELFGKLAQAISELPGWAKQLVGGFTVLTGVSLTLVGAGALLVTTVASLVNSYNILTTAMGVNLAAMKASTAQSLMLSGSVTNLTLAKIAATKATAGLSVAMQGLITKAIAIAPLLGLAALAAGSVVAAFQTWDGIVGPAERVREATENARKPLEDYRKELLALQGVSGDAFKAEQLESNLQRIQENLSLAQKGFDKLILTMKGISDGLDDMLPKWAELALNLTPLGFIINGVGNATTNLEATTNRLTVANGEMIQSASEVADEAAIMISAMEKGAKLDTGFVEAMTSSLNENIQVLQGATLTNQAEIDARDQMVETLRGQISTLTELTKATEDNTDGTDGNTQSLEDQEKALKEAEKAWQDYQQKVRGSLAAIDAQAGVDLASLSGSDTSKITEGLKIEENATNQKIALLRDLASQSKTTAEERRDIEIEIQKLMLEANQKRIEANQQLEEKYNQFQRDRLSVARSEFERSVIEQNLTTEQAFNQRKSFLEQEFNLESQILKDKIASAAQNSAERKGLEKELADLQLGYARDQKALQDDLTAYQKEQSDKRKENELKNLEELKASNNNYFENLKAKEEGYLQVLQLRQGYTSDMLSELEKETSIIGNINSLLNSGNTTLGQRADLIGLAEQITEKTFTTNKNMSAMEQASLALQKRIADNEVLKIQLKIRQLELDRETLRVQTEISQISLQNRRADIQAELAGDSSLTANQRASRIRELESISRQEAFNETSRQNQEMNIGFQIDMARFEQQLAEVMSRNIGGTTANDLVSRAQEASRGSNRGAERIAIGEARQAFREGTITREDLDQILQTSRDEAQKRSEEAQKAREESRTQNERSVSTQERNVQVNSEGFSRVSESTSQVSGEINSLVRVNSDILSVNRQISSQLSDIAQRVSSLPQSIASLIPRPAPQTPPRR